jgi:hypothetical protein
MRTFWFYPIIWNFVIVIVVITGITNPILVIVFLSRVGEVGAVVLGKGRHT